MKYSLENVFTVNLPKFWHQKVKNNIYEDNYEFPEYLSKTKYKYYLYNFKKYFFCHPAQFKD